jgi:hypothetical protein
LLAVCGCLAAMATSASAEVPQATLLPSGRTVAPPSAPPAVKAMIEAANRISHRPYHWGGSSNWVRTYANREHVFAVIAGLRWDTSMTDDGDRSGPGWSEYMRPGNGFRLRHPLGLLQALPLA